jgi:integrase
VGHGHPARASGRQAGPDRLQPVTGVNQSRHHDRRGGGSVRPPGKPKGRARRSLSGPRAVGTGRALIVLGAGTGLRISTAPAVTNDRVDWFRRAVTIDRQLVCVGGGVPAFGPVKDKKSRARTIPVPRSVVDALAEHLRVYGLGPGGVLFAGERGRPLWRTNFSEIWREAAAPLGIVSGDGFHQLRYFSASLLIRHGGSVKVVQDRLALTSVQMTLGIYSHLWPEDEDRTQAAIDDVFILSASRAENHQSSFGVSSRVPGVSRVGS